MWRSSMPTTGTRKALRVSRSQPGIRWPPPDSLAARRGGAALVLHRPSLRLQATSLPFQSNFPLKNWPADMGDASETVGDRPSALPTEPVV
jgi:hypothetical protein